MMSSMLGNKWRPKVEVARAATMVVEAIKAARKVIRLVEVNHLVTRVRIRINLGRSSKWWCKHNSKAAAKRATDTMMVIRLWREPDTRHTTMHLHQGLDLVHWIRMITSKV